MNIHNFTIKNYRLLKDFSLNVEKELSLVIGKNNCGKTSLIGILDKFLNDRGTRAFSCNDFNIDFQKRLKSAFDNNLPFSSNFWGISLKLFIKYDPADDLSNASRLMMDLDPDNNNIVLGFEYALSETGFNDCKSAYLDYKANKVAKIDKKQPDEKATPEEKKLFDEIKTENKKFIFYEFFKEQQDKFFKLTKKTFYFDLATNQEDDSNYIDLDEANIKLDKLINLQIINARRDVSNKDNDKSLSFLSSKYYEKNEASKSESPAIQQFKEILSDTDGHLNEVYKGMFNTVIKRVEKFGGIDPGDSIIKIISTLQHRELLKGNTTVMYDHNAEHSLPEHYNGLGYMNLIGMIFELEVLISDFRKEQREHERPADINILIIEEPEAHTHPQMQYVFIKNIKSILKDASTGENGTKPIFNLQTIITTHSSHIAAESDFNDIKYFSRSGKNAIIAKSLRDLEAEYEKDGETESFKFLKQYLTLNRAELFFADKAILIEGDTERILLPAMMRKLDFADNEKPLLSQNISIVEVGAYSQIYEKFIHFLGIKTLIITDIDSAKFHPVKTSTGKDSQKLGKCPIDEATHITNSALVFFHDDTNDFQYYLKLTQDYKIRRKHPRKRKWVANRKGHVLLVYQLPEKNTTSATYHARSFEDAFFHLNDNLLRSPRVPYSGLKPTYLDDFLQGNKNLYDFLDKGINSKPTLAMEILLNSTTNDSTGEQYSNWSIPGYIKDGLLWLKKD